MLTRLLALSIVLGFSVATLSAQSSPDEQLAKLAEKYGVSEKVMKAALRANSELGRSTVKAQAALHFFAKHGAEGVGAVCALIERGHDPFQGMWALPGGFIEMDERLIDSTRRELEEETGIRAKWLAPACFAGDPGRDPRGRTVSAVFYTLMPEVQKALENVYYDTAISPFLYRPEIYHHVIRLIGADRILFGSDYPVLPADRLLKEIDATGIPEEDKMEILSGNARRLLNI